MLASLQSDVYFEAEVAEEDTEDQAPDNEETAPSVPKCNLYGILP